MAKLDIAKHYPAINEAANLFLDNLGSAFAPTSNGHIETDIAGAGSMAGLTLLRPTKVDLTKCKSDAHALGAQPSMKICYTSTTWLVRRSQHTWCCEPVNQMDLDACWHRQLWYPAWTGKHVG